MRLASPFHVEFSPTPHSLPERRQQPVVRSVDVRLLPAKLDAVRDPGPFNSVVVFLNKIDLLQRKLKTSRLADYMPEYEGDNSFDDVTGWFAKCVVPPCV